MESSIDEQLSTARMRDGDHLAVSYADAARLAIEVSDFVRRGIERDQMTVLFITQEESERYRAFLRDAAIDVEKMIDSGDLAIELIDELLVGDKPINVMSGWVSTKVASYCDSARRAKKDGLNILGNIAGNLAKLKRYEECLSLESFWHQEIIPNSSVPVTLLCPYDIVPAELQVSLQEPHSTMTRVFSGAREEIEQFITAVIQRAASDPIEPVMEAIQYRSGTGFFFLPFVEFIKRMREAYPAFQIRFITSIEATNLEEVKRIVAIEGSEVRHIDGIKARYAATRREYIGTTRAAEAGPPAEVLWSNSLGLVSQMRSVFELLWESAIPASARINDIENGRSIGATKLTFDPKEIMSSASRFVDGAREEALILSPREGGIKENIDFFRKVASKSREGVRVKVLGRFSKEDATLLEAMEQDGAEVRKLGASESIGLALGIYDRNAMGLVQSAPRSGDGGQGMPDMSGIISTDARMISGVAALFDHIWDESERRQRAELMKDILTHDIRNYNQIARANAELLQSELEDGKQLEFTRSILRAMDNSTDLIQRTRTLGDLASRPHKDLRPVGVSESLHRAFSVIRNATPAERTISLFWSARFAQWQVLADELLDQVFVNIFSNAVRYTEGPDVSIEVIVEEAGDPQVGADIVAARERRFLKITIIDHARGMPDMMKETVSMRYLGAAKGRGLGLSIVRALVVERYGGKIQFRNRVEGDHTRGTKVELWLPKI